MIWFSIYNHFLRAKYFYITSINLPSNNKVGKRVPQKAMPISDFNSERCEKQSKLGINQNLSPLILLASWRSLVMMVTLLAWMAARLVSSKSETRQASAASWRARTAELWNLSSCLNSWAISRTSLWKGSFLMRRSVDFWYFLISLRATVPGLKRWGFLTPVVTGADFLAIFWATSCFLGTFWAVDFLAVCFVRAMFKDNYYGAFEYL